VCATGSENFHASKALSCFTLLTLALLYILEVICFIGKYRQSVELNSSVHTYNTQKQTDIHIKSYNIEMYKKKFNKHGDLCI